MRKQAKQTYSNIRSTATWVVILVVFIAQLLFYTWCRVNHVRVGYEISRETLNYNDLVTLQSNLKIELARLKSPERIEKIAKTRLGLIRPEQKQMITIR